MENSQRKKITIIVGAFVVLCVVMIAITIYQSLSRQGKIEVSITTYPAGATIQLDGKSAGTKEYLPEGTYTFKASKNGFKDKEVTQFISNTSNQVFLILDPDSEEARRWRNSQRPIDAEYYGGQAAQARGQALAAKYPLMTKLPYVSVSGPFRIDFGYTGPNNSEVYFIIGNSTPSGRRAAISWIRSQGIEVEQLDLRFKDYTNPLTKESAS